jgi:hypothetical protein
MPPEYYLGNGLAVCVQLTFWWTILPKLCPESPASVRLFIQRKGDDLTRSKEFWRWWSDPVSAPLARRRCKSRSDVWNTIG